jgi:hypothetical protein
VAVGFELACISFASRSHRNEHHALQSANTAPHAIASVYIIGRPAKNSSGDPSPALVNNTTVAQTLGSSVSWPPGFLLNS